MWSLVLQKPNAMLSDLLKSVIDPCTTDAVHTIHIHSN